MKMAKSFLKIRLRVQANATTAVEKTAMTIIERRDAFAEDGATQAPAQNCGSVVTAILKPNLFKLLVLSSAYITAINGVTQTKAVRVKRRGRSTTHKMPNAERRTAMITSERKKYPDEPAIYMVTNLKTFRIGALHIAR